MKTLQPLILTARVAQGDMQPFDLLRQRHFPPQRNFLSAHLTMFHRLPGEYRPQLIEHLVAVASKTKAFEASVTGLRHLGAGVAFTIVSAELQDIHTRLKSNFAPWLGGQDMQTWRPHITIQNKVSKASADELYASLMNQFEMRTIEIAGLDLWQYLDGPWRHETSVDFESTA